MPAIDLNTPPQTPEYVPSLGRLHAPDDRDKRFMLPQPPRLATLPTSKHWMSKGKPLDQGQTSACVGYSTVRYLTTHPVPQPSPLPPFELYRECQRVDEWPGEEGGDPHYYGTSVRAAFRVLKARGLVSEYRWATNVDTVLAHVLTAGPVVMGTDWFSQFMSPGDDGYLWPAGGVIGGHAWLIIGASRNRANPDGTKGAVRMINSWSGSWGQNGRAWVSLDVLALLLAANGEAAVATEVKVA